MTETFRICEYVDGWAGFEPIYETAKMSTFTSSSRSGLLYVYAHTCVCMRV